MKHFKGAQGIKVWGPLVYRQIALEFDAPLNPQTHASFTPRLASPRTSLLHSYHRVVIVASCAILAPVLSQIFES
jgi:hypothetical protein